MARSRLGERKSSIMAQRNKLTGILNTLQRKKSNNFRGGEKMRVRKEKQQRKETGSIVVA